MSPMLWQLYDRALFLLPPAFRHQYSQQIAQTARDAAADHHSLVDSFSLFSDLALTTFRENARMFSEQISRRPFFYQALCLSAVAFVLALGGYAVMQQTIRRAANQPQQQMADDTVRKYMTYDRMESSCSPSCTDLSTSLQPFTIAYDENLKAINSDAVLSDAVPTLPAGVFGNARRFGSNTLTWQPRPGVRLAIVVRHFTGAHYSGFVLVGRSLATAEQGESIARWSALLGWLSIVVLLTLSATVFSRFQRPQQPA